MPPYHANHPSAPRQLRTIQPAAVVPLPSVALGLAIAPDPVGVGETASITVTLENRGDAAATSFQCTAASYTVPDKELTCAQYDGFGRMVALIKPNDSTSAPTVQAIYHDVDATLVLPLRYEVRRRDTSSDGVRVLQQYYDGLGRQVQTKAESQDAAQNTITDMLYDGMSRTFKQSQARYVSQSGAAFSAYTAPGGPLNNPIPATWAALARIAAKESPSIRPAAPT